MTVLESCTTTQFTTIICNEFVARHARGNFEVFNNIEISVSGVEYDVCRSTLCAVFAQFPLSAVLRVITISFPSPTAHSKTSPSVVNRIDSFHRLHESPPPRLDPVLLGDERERKHKERRWNVEKVAMPIC